MEQKEEQNKNPVTSTQTEEPKKEKQPLTEAQRQKRNKLIVYPLMGLMFMFDVVDIRTVRGGQTEGAAIAGLQYRNAACRWYGNHR